MLSNAIVQFRNSIIRKTNAPATSNHIVRNRRNNLRVWKLRKSGAAKSCNQFVRKFWGRWIDIHEFHQVARGQYIIVVINTTDTSKFADTVYKFLYAILPAGGTQRPSHLIRSAKKQKMKTMEIAAKNHVPSFDGFVEFSCEDVTTY